MKINEVEQLLSITKANIRFYEKEGLLTPGRSDNGYRDYTDGDITRLKEIIIYRKLGIPVQQIADILDGALPLQEALDENIKTLNEEIEKLNGSLALCQQLKLENADALDTPRYWDILQNKENAGYRFQSIVSDYISFLAPTLEWIYLIPEDAWHSPKRIVKYLLIWSFAGAGLLSLANGDFGGSFIRMIFIFIRGILFWVLLFIPIYLLSRKKAALAKTLEVMVPVGILLLITAIAIWMIIAPGMQ